MFITYCTEETRTVFYNFTSQKKYAWRKVNAVDTTKAFTYLGYQYTQGSKSDWGKLIFYQVNNILNMHVYCDQIQNIAFKYITLQTRKCIL
jgi:hypothetical protein